MKDIFGLELKEGDTVATTWNGYTYTLCVGTVRGFTPKKVVVESKNGTIAYKFPEQLAKKVS